MMSLCSAASIEIKSICFDNNDDDSDAECDDLKFREVVFEFIERIGTFDENYEPNISANDFRHIELQIQAKRVGKVLELCISKIRLVFYLSHLIEHQRDHLILYFSTDEARRIEVFSENWSHGAGSVTSSDLNRCLDIVDRVQANKDKCLVSVFLNGIGFLKVFQPPKKSQ